MDNHMLIRILNHKIGILIETIRYHEQFDDRDLVAKAKNQKQKSLT